MYNSYFGFNDAPFSIAPNPHYLFLSDRHREALAHLTYGMSDSGGFVLLTGEVGTGKTTVSRCLMEQLPEDTQSAFVLNPTLSELELLGTVCDELRIRYRKADATLKILTDKIRNRLLKNHENGINTLLIIDEAQHLRPEALEQLRLLTNLETHTKKLLKVILIGQPELQQLLRRQDLRQLAQRITARYHLLPLNRQEVVQYIQHRIQVAGGERPVFTSGAIAAIHKLSGGIPRLINLLCDRALLGAYGKSQLQVKKKTVMEAADEALGREIRLSWWQKNKTVLSSVAATLAIVTSALFAYNLSQNNTPEPVKTEPVAVVPPSPVNQLLAIAGQGQQVNEAFSSVLNRWQVNTQLGVDPCTDINVFGLACYWQTSTTAHLVSLDRPAVLQLSDAMGQAFYAVFTEIDNDKVGLSIGGKQFWLSQTELASIWRGNSVVIWQPPFSEAEVINQNSDLDRLQWLENSISYYFNRTPRIIDSMDAVLINDLALFQRQKGLTVSEEVDVLTQIHLNSAIALPVPRIRNKGLI